MGSAIVPQTIKLVDATCGAIPNLTVGVCHGGYRRYTNQLYRPPSYGDMTAWRLMSMSVRYM